MLTNTRFIGPWLWSLLSTADKLRFQRRFGSQWTAHRYAMPIQTDGLYAVGQILSGELFATNAFWCNVDCLTVIVDRIVGRLHAQEPPPARGEHRTRDGATLPALRQIA